MRSPHALAAERDDDGILVTAPAGLSGQRIVWIGDVELEVADGLRAPGAPRFRIDATAAAVEVVWALAADEVRVRLTLPCRPVGALTFENNELDPRVEMLPSPYGPIARVRPYRGLPALRLSFDGELRFEADPCWRRGVEVFDAAGTRRLEDRFSPGVFVVRRPSASRELRLVARVDTAQRACVSEVPVVHASDADELSEVLAMPGIVAAGAASTGDLEADIACWFERHLGRVLEDGHDGAHFAHDGVLWLARTAFLLERSLVETSPDARSDELCRDVLRPGVLRIADAVFERAASAGGDPSAPFRGARRWYETFGALPRDAPPAVGVETAALLHQLFVHITRLAQDDGAGALAARTQRAALGTRRWFQRSFWLATPGRLADVEVDRMQVGDGAPLARRPHMLLAASFVGAPLDRAQRRAVVRSVDEHLVTALGIRSLAVADDLHDPRSLSDGATWPWLLGPYVEASLRAFGHERGRVRAHRVLLGGLASAPQAWCERGAGASPLGVLDFLPTTGEAARASAMLDSRSQVENRR